MKLPINQIITGDCLEVMQGFPDNSADLVVTDPPYNVGKDYGKDHNDNLPYEEYWEWYKNVFQQVYRILKNGYCYVSSTSFQDDKVKALLTDIGFTWVQNLIWYHPNMIRGGHYISKPWVPLHEVIGMYLKGKRIAMLNPYPVEALSHDVMTFASPQRNYKNGRFHITQKPLKLYKTIISRTPGSIVFDPFIGSGTSAVAAKQCGRNFTGIENNPECVEIANKRISGVKPSSINQDLFIEVQS